MKKVTKVMALLAILSITTLLAGCDGDEQDPKVVKTWETDGTEFKYKIYAKAKEYEAENVDNPAYIYKEDGNLVVDGNWKKDEHVPGDRFTAGSHGRRVVYWFPLAHIRKVSDGNNCVVTLDSGEQQTLYGVSGKIVADKIAEIEKEEEANLNAQIAELDEEVSKLGATANKLAAKQEEVIVAMIVEIEKTVAAKNADIASLKEENGILRGEEGVHVILTRMEAFCWGFGTPMGVILFVLLLRSSLRRKIKLLREKVESALKAKDTAEEELAEIEKLIQEDTDLIKSVADIKETLETRVTELEEAAVKLNAEILRLTIERDTVKRNFETVAGKNRTLENRNKELEETVSTLETAKTNVERELAELKRQLDLNAASLAPLLRREGDADAKPETY